MKSKASDICKACLWGCLVLLFPIASGVFSVVFSLDTVQVLVLQGSFMLISLIPPVVLVMTGKWSWSEIGFARFDFENAKRALYFIPVLVIFVPAAVEGFKAESVGYVLGSLFLYLFVGISEEVYFRGIVPKYLKTNFSVRGIIILSTIIFGIGHITAAFTANSLFDVALTLLNAFIFGWLAIEMTIIASNIIPSILVHFFFDFETKIVAMESRELLIAEVTRGALMFIIAMWFAFLIHAVPLEPKKIWEGSRDYEKLPSGLR